MLSFSVALTRLKEGKSIARSGWNGKGMWLIYVNAHDYNLYVGVSILGLEKLPWIAMKTADNKIVPWLASQTDILAEDWEVKA